MNNLRADGPETAWKPKSRFFRNVLPWTLIALSVPVMQWLRTGSNQFIAIFVAVLPVSIAILLIAKRFDTRYVAEMDADAPRIVTGIRTAGSIRAWQFLNSSFGSHFRLSMLGMLVLGLAWWTESAWVLGLGVPAVLILGIIDMRRRELRYRQAHEEARRGEDVQGLDT